MIVGYMLFAVVKEQYTNDLCHQPAEENEMELVCFQTLSQAVDFIATQVEHEAIQGLTRHFAHIRRANFQEPAYSEHFSKRVFPELKRVHQEKDLRALYRGRRFPENVQRYTLGGHMAELGCLHIDFERVQDGWILDEIWECR
jgi:hypothetical protein